MSRLVITLPNDRNFCGQVELVGGSGDPVCGPFAVTGRSSDHLAAIHRNPQRIVFLPYGDTPTGNFLIRSHVPTGKGSPLAKSEYGPWGALVLEGITGDAAIADANGRFNFLIHGGDLSETGKLRSTAGGLRMHNAELRTLIGAVNKSHCKSCEIIEVDGATGEAIHNDDKCALSDPLPLALTRPARDAGSMHLPRRGAVLAAVGATFVAQGTLHAAPIQAAFASSPRTPAPRAVYWVPAAIAAADGIGQAYNPPGPGTTGRTPSAATSPQVQSSPIDKDKVVETLEKKAEKNPTFGYCATACREALKAGGMSTTGNPELAGDYGKFLEKHGAVVVDTEPKGETKGSPSKYQKGDIAVFDKSPEHPAGHIQIYDGNGHWYSDHKQNGPYSPYKKPETTPPSTVYRLPDKK